MPSIFHRSRRSSEGTPAEPTFTKRRSVDASSPPSAGKFKSFLKSGESDSTKKESLRKRLTSPSTFFSKQQPETFTQDASPAVNGESAADRYQNLQPRTNGGSSNQMPSPTFSPESYSLFGTSSPERAAGNRRGSVSWQPSYPSMVPDDSYADIPPDGQANGVPATVNGSENSSRRSNDMPSLSAPPELLPSFPVMKPDEKPSRQPVSPTSSPLVAQTAAETFRPSQTGQMLNGHQPVASADLPIEGSSPSEMPGSSTTLNQTKPSRPIPNRRITLLQSPPMPQPIKNLPTMTGWAGFNREAGGSLTPSWGVLAREGGPKTPGGWMTPRTPGGGFPFSTAGVTQNHSQEKGKMTEGESRKARRAMPVMLREPSFRPPIDDGGEAEDDSDESGTEVEEHPDDDSEPETETGTITRTRQPTTPRNDRKGKGRASSGVGRSPIVASTVQEEEDSPPPAIASRRPAASRLGQIQTNFLPPTKRQWGLPTPTGQNAPMYQFPHGSWTQFGAETPSGNTSATLSGPSTASLSRTHSSIGSSRASPSDGYFGSQASASQISFADSNGRTVEPVLAGGNGHGVLDTQPRAHGPDMSGLGLAPPISGVVSHSRPHDGDNGDADESDYDTAEGSPDGSHEGPGQSPSPAATELKTPSTPSADLPRPSAAKRPSLYSQVSRSMVNLSSTSSSTAPIPDHSEVKIAPQERAVPARGPIPGHIQLPPQNGVFPNGLLSPGSEWSKPPPTPAAGFGGFSWMKPAVDQSVLKRRRSADDINAPPPQYSLPLPGTWIPKPRDEEGKEKLPAYWCAVHIEGSLSRKLEFSAPGVQSRDRSWKKLYCILRGTQLLVYKFDPHRFPLKSDAPVPFTNEAESGGSIHVHVPGERRPPITSTTPPPASAPGARRGSIDGTSPSNHRGPIGGSPLVPLGERRGSVSSTATSNASGDVKDPALFAAAAAQRRRGASVSNPSTSSVASSTAGSSLASHFQNNSLIKQYTLQKAESGLAADYVKKKNVVRVRAEGEQFLLQTEDAREVVDWIEAFQAATNVALDLDERPMPKIITLPRRRRRRPAGAAGAAGAAAATAPGAAANTSAGASDANPPTADTAAGNIAAVEQSARERDRDILQDQAAN